MLKGTFINWSRTVSFYVFGPTRCASMKGTGGRGVERVWGHCYGLGRFPFSWKFQKFSWLEIKWKGPFLFSPTGIFGGGRLWPIWSFRLVKPKCSFPFDNFLWLSLVPLFGAPLTRTITKCAVAWVLCSVQPECAVPLGTWNFKLDFLWNERASCDHAQNYKLAMVNVHVIQNKSFGCLNISLVLLFFCFRSFMLFVFVTNWLPHKAARLWDKTRGVSGYFALVLNPGKILGKLREILPYYLDHEGVTEVQTSGNLRFEDSLLINCTYPPPPTKWPSSQIMHGLGHYMKSYTKYITQIQYT